MSCGKILSFGQFQRFFANIISTAHSLQPVQDLRFKQQGIKCFCLWFFIIDLFDTWHGFLTTSEINQDSFDIWWKLMFSSYYQSKLCHFHTFNWDLLLTKLIMISWELRHNHNQKVSNLGDMKREVTWHDKWSARTKVGYWKSCTVGTWSWTIQ